MFIIPNQAEMGIFQIWQNNPSYLYAFDVYVFNAELVCDINNFIMIVKVKFMVKSCWIVEYLTDIYPMQFVSAQSTIP